MFPGTHQSLATFESKHGDKSHNPEPVASETNY